jgi:hypothetical protein
MLPCVGGKGFVQPGSRRPPSDDRPAMIAVRRVMGLLMFISFSNGHRAHLLFESGLYYHYHVNRQKQFKRNRSKEVYGPCRLSAEEYFQ